MFTITRKFTFDAGHRVLNHESKCKHIHGHTFHAEVTVTAERLDRIGRVIDFGVLKQIVGKWIDDYWDHNLILHEDDPLLKVVNPDEIFGSKRPFILGGRKNPTSENLAEWLFCVARELLPPEIKVVGVRIHETPSCFSDYADPVPNS